MSNMTFAVRKRLEAEDYGEEMGDGFFMADLGREEDSSPGPAVTAPGINSQTPKTTYEREKLAGSMAAQLMDYYMQPEVLNNINILNPIRDGIPQCRAHPFVSGDSTKIGCINGCGSKERDFAGNLPVARDGTLGDAWEWVKGLVTHAILTQDKRLGYSAGGPDLTGR